MTALLAPSTAFAMLAAFAWFGPIVLVGLIAGLPQLARKLRDPIVEQLEQAAFESELGLLVERPIVEIFNASDLAEQVATLERAEKLATDAGGTLEALVATMPSASHVLVYIPDNDELVAVLNLVEKTLSPSVLFDEMPIGAEWPVATVNAEAHGLAFQPFHRGNVEQAQA